MRVYGWLIFSVFLQVVFQRCHLVKNDRNGGVAQKGDQKAGLSREDLREDRERRQHSSSRKHDSRRRSRSSSRDRHRSAVSPIHDTRRSSGDSFHFNARNQARSSRAKSPSEFPGFTAPSCSDTEIRRPQRRSEPRHQLALRSAAQPPRGAQ